MLNFKVIGVVILGISSILFSGCTTQFSQPTNAACIKQLELLVYGPEPDRNWAFDVLGEEIPEGDINCAIGPNDRYAMSLFGRYHLLGAKTGENYKVAAKFLKAAAMPSSGYTQIYLAGFGSVPASFLSVKTGLSTSGDAEAQYLLGWIYANGLAGSVKEGKARKWLKRASSQGHDEAISLLQTLTTQEE